jgi:hypothetical protein
MILSDHSRRSRHRHQQEEYRGGEYGDARVTAAPAAEVLDCEDTTGEDGTALEKTSEVGGERVGVGVAAVGLLLEALQADFFQITRDLGLQLCRRHRSWVRTRSMV